MIRLFLDANVLFTAAHNPGERMPSSLVNKMSGVLSMSPIVTG